MNVFLLLNPGYQCEMNIDDCASDPCKNGGQCVDGVAEYECRCKPGFQGFTCEIDIDECLSAPCRNNATCSDGVNAFKSVYSNKPFVRFDMFHHATSAIDALDFYQVSDGYVFMVNSPNSQSDGTLGSNPNISLNARSY